MAWINSRISTLQLNLFARKQVATATARLQIASKEMTTGLKENVFSDLGPMAAVTLSLRSTDRQMQAYITSNGVLDSKISTMLNAVDSVRKSVGSVFELVSVNSTNSSMNTKTLQLQAEAALKSMISTLNVSYSGSHLFSGIKSENTALQNWDQSNPATGQSPKDVLKSIVGSGPTTPAEANAMIAKINSIYDSTNTADPTKNYEGTFYNGKPLVDAAGHKNARVTARIEPNRTLNYGVQANDAAFRDLHKGLAILTAVDVNKITDKKTYKIWMQAAASALSSGISKALDISTLLGFHQQVIQDTVVRQKDMSFIYKTRISGFESVDPYEAATRVKSLENQLQASYSVSARLSKLTILNYL